MNNVAIRLSPGFIPAAAKTVARRSGLIAIPAMLFGAFLMLLVVLDYIALASDKHAAAPLILVLPFVSLAIGGYGIRMLVQQRRATLAAVKAHADPTTFWYLMGFVVAPHIRGIPDHSLSFTVPPKMRMHLASAGRYRLPESAAGVAAGRQ